MCEMYDKKNKIKIQIKQKNMTQMEKSMKAKNDMKKILSENKETILVKTIKCKREFKTKNIQEKLKKDHAKIISNGKNDI